MLKTLRSIHKWSGLLLALPLILQCLTGIVLAADPFFEPAGSAIDPAKVPAVFTTAQQAVPPGLTPRRIRGAGAAGTLIDFADPHTPGAMTEIALDTATQHVLWVHKVSRGVYGLAHEWHETLLLGPWGRSLIGWSGLGLFLLGVTGIPLWWPSPSRWKAALTVSKKARGWRLFRELHGAGGAWIIALLLLQSLSGATMAFPQTSRALLGLPVQQRVGGVGGGHGHHATQEDTPELDLGAAVAAATQAAPGASMRQIRFPPSRHTLNILLLPQGAFEGAPMINVSVNGESGHVLNVQNPGGIGRESLLGWLRSLHSGGGLGAVWRVVICLLGITLPLLPVTGVLMWLRRKPRRVATRVGETQAC